MVLSNNKVIIDGYVKTKPILEESYASGNIYSFLLYIPNDFGSNEVKVRVHRTSHFFDILQKSTRVKVSGELRARPVQTRGKTFTEMSIMAVSVGVLPDTRRLENKVTLNGELVRKGMNGVNSRGLFFQNATMRVKGYAGKYTLVPISLSGDSAKALSETAVGVFLKCRGSVFALKQDPQRYLDLGCLVKVFCKSFEIFDKGDFDKYYQDEEQDYIG